MRSMRQITSRNPVTRHAGAGLVTESRSARSSSRLVSNSGVKQALGSIVVTISGNFTSEFISKFK